MIKKLNSMPYAKAVIHIDNDTIMLQSYNTIVAVIKNNWLTVYGLYSATTRKHISAFMREYTPFNYYTAKNCYLNDLQLNIETGEVVGL